MRGWVPLVAALGGCGFTISGGQPPTDGEVTPDTTVPDVMVAPDAGCAVTRRWDTDFSSDPVATGMFALRSMPVATALPPTLADGVWTVGKGVSPLDTAPAFDFNGHTVAHAIMRVTSETPASATTPGAVLWVNVGFGDGTIAPIYVAVDKRGAMQHLTLFTHTTGNVPVALERRMALGDGMLDIILEVDIATHTVQLTVDGITSAFTFGEIAQTNSDRWASLYAWASNAEFDQFTVDACQ